MMLAPHAAIQPRPLGCVNTAMRDLDRSYDGVCWLVEEGKLVAFNIAAPGKARKSLRILTASIEHYRETRQAFERPWPEIFRLIVRHELLFLRSPEIDRALNCDPKQASALISAGCFTVARNGRAGNGCAAIITRASFEKFLWDRLEGGEL